MNKNKKTVRTEFGVWIAGQVLTNHGDRKIMTAEQAIWSAEHSHIKGVKRIPVTREVRVNEIFKENGDQVTVIIKKAWMVLEVEDKDE